MERYINPFADYGFKKLFATEQNKDLLISLLNAIIDDSNNPADPITDLQYKNVEQIGDIIGTRTNYFDVYCQTRTGRQFIVEMQNTWKPFFKDRTVYYAAKPIREQGDIGLQKARDRARKESERIRKREKKENEERERSIAEYYEKNGIKRRDELRFQHDKEFMEMMEKKHEKEYRKKRSQGFDFRLQDVYLIAIMNFMLPNKEYAPDSYFHKIKLVDIEDHHVFYDKLTLYYIEMPKLEFIDLKLVTMRDKWMHALTYLYFYDEYPEELQEDVFKKLFEQAELARYTPAQQLTYERSWKVYLDTLNDIEGARILGKEEGLQQGHEKGLAEGREKGLAEGREIERNEIIEKLKAAGMEQQAIEEMLGNN